MNIIEKYFPHLTDEQKKQFAALDGLYRDWNAKINVISRKDIDNLYEHHVLHSLAIAKAINFRPGSEILDFGCGGGFPGIPLAIVHPDCHFVLCDSIGKKIKVVEHIARTLQLDNVTPVVSRAEALPQRSFQVVVSRAVTRLEKFLPLVQNKTTEGARLLFLKGGDLSEEIEEAAKLCKIPPERFAVTSLSDCFGTLGNGFFKTKKICEIKQTLYLCTPLS